MVVHDPNAAECRDVLCQSKEPDRQKIDLAAYGYSEVPLLNTNELMCGRRPNPTGGSDT